METAESIVAFWFGNDPDDRAVVEQQSSLWWVKNEETDREIRRRFLAGLEAAAAGELDAWRATPHGTLSLILLTDQFSRNMFRGSARSFATDPLARSWAEAAIDFRQDIELRLVERVFVYLPFEHSESLADQRRSVELYRSLLEQADSELEGPFRQYLDFAIAHRDIVERFGRFPHRNRILRRESSPEEIAFLEQPGSAF
jgi:uncharacterized protein (DUF924 family)